MSILQTVRPERVRELDARFFETILVHKPMVRFGLVLWGLAAASALIVLIVCAFHHDEPRFKAFGVRPSAGPSLSSVVKASTGELGALEDSNMARVGDQAGLQQVVSGAPKGFDVPYRAQQY